MRCGIEFEYLLIDTQGPSAGRIRDFSNLTLSEISAMLGDKPGLTDARLARGDLGIRSGYWYLEGDERFAEDGEFRTLAVKGVEIRTPPEENVTAAVSTLLQLEAALAAQLAKHALGLAMAGYNPVREAYVHEPPLNAFEQKLRREEPAYDGSLVSTLTYGPDINLSLPGWSVDQCLDAARKLNWYAPYIVPFSFSSPYAEGKIWPGCSKRTWERASQRPAVKAYVFEQPEQLTRPLMHEARSAHEHGRVEFKAFDATPSARLLSACSQLLVGLCLDEQLCRRSDDADIALYRRAAQHGFADPDVYAGAKEVFDRARLALSRAGDLEAVRGLEPLTDLLERRCTPAQDLLAKTQHGAPLYWPGGLADHY